MPRIRTLRTLSVALAFAGTSFAATTATPVIAAEAQLKIANVVPAAAPRNGKRP